MPYFQRFKSKQKKKMLTYLQIVLHSIKMNGLFDINVYTGMLNDFIKILCVK